MVIVVYMPHAKWVFLRLFGSRLMKREGRSIMEVGYLGRLELRMREWWKRKAHMYRSASKVNFIFVFMNPSVTFFRGS
jgi:hypothetical protein